VYGLPKMARAKDHARLAHHGPDPKHKKARGVFAVIQPTSTGATLIRRKLTVGGDARIKLSDANLDTSLKLIISRREQVKGRMKVNEKVDPNKPGTVQGGQFESNRRKH
jgi:hypothetical protein